MLCVLGEILWWWRLVDERNVYRSAWSCQNWSMLPQVPLDLCLPRMVYGQEDWNWWVWLQNCLSSAWTEEVPNLPQWSINWGSGRYSKQVWRLAWNHWRPQLWLIPCSYLGRRRYPAPLSLSYLLFERLSTSKKGPWHFPQQSYSRTNLHTDMPHHNIQF